MSKEVDRNITCVLFDFFGTLAEHRDNAINLYDDALLPLRGLMPNGDLCCVGERWESTLREMARYATKTQDELSMYELAERVGSEFRQLGISRRVWHEVADRFMERWQAGVRFCEDTLEVIPRLGERFRLGIISNTMHEPMVPNLLEKAGLSEHFGAIVTSVGVSKRKPSPFIFRHACDLLNVAPEQCCFVGDNYEEDFIGAKAASMMAVQIARRDDGGMIGNLWELEEMLKGSHF